MLASPRVDSKKVTREFMPCPKRRDKARIAKEVCKKCTRWKKCWKEAGDERDKV